MTNDMAGGIYKETLRLERKLPIHTQAKLKMDQLFGERAQSTKKRKLSSTLHSGCVCFLDDP